MTSTNSTSDSEARDEKMDFKHIIKQNYVTCIKYAIGIICLIAFLYQMIELLIFYSSEPKVLEVQYRKPEKFIFPAITFCNANLIKRSKYCEAYPKRCIKPENMTKFCERYPHYCKFYEIPERANIEWTYDEDFMLPKETYFLGRDFVPMEELVNFSDNASTIVFASVGKDDVEGPKFYEKPRRSTLIPCFTQYSRIDSELEPHTSLFSPFDGYSRQVSDYPQMIQRLSLDVEAKEYFNPTIKPGAYFTLHSPYESLNPNYKGVFMEAGKSYHIHVQLEVDHLSIMEGDCIDYVDRWQKGGKKDPRSQQTCLERCKLDYSLSCYDCVERPIMYPTTREKCSFDNASIHCKANNGAIYQYRNCLSSCKKDCISLKFHFDVQENPDIETLFYDKMWRLIDISIYMHEPRLLVRSYKPKIDSNQVFSSIGGFLCIWICIFLLLTKFVEYVPNFVNSLMKRQSNGVT